MVCNYCLVLFIPVLFLSYNGHSILAGTGTIGKEICEDMKQRNVPLDAVVVPVGGAGLIAGISLAVKTLSPQSEVIVST